MQGVTRGELENLRQAMLLGTARRPLAPPPALASVIAAAAAASVDPALALLALAGQHFRFERPPPPALRPLPEAALRLHADPRPIVPESGRRALARLIDWAHKDWAAVVIAAAAGRI